jgi:ABC-type polysaccharide/polyol phosphate transport system ATPase subunit
MLPEGAISARHVWKRFRADRSKRELRDSMRRVKAQFGGQRTRWTWALQDVTLEVEPGDSVALLGPNGSGKSTLLKILTRVMYPYAGSMEVSGRVGALIEVRAGLHPELSGRENVYLYGTLLGLRRREVVKRFDDIIEFAELQQAVDRQVKFYSSGMQMRLGFAVAAFLEPDVLLVDEILAVGDASFQHRCTERMHEVLAQGTTLVFVSHDLAAVEATCRRGLWLQNGVVQADGPIGEVMGGYREWIDTAAASGGTMDGIVRLRRTTVAAPGRDELPRSFGPLDVELSIESPESTPATVYVGITEGTAAPIVLLQRQLHLAAGTTDLRCSIANLPLPRGRFYVWVVAYDVTRTLLPWQPAGSFDIVGPDLNRSPHGIVQLAPVQVQATWEEDRGDAASAGVPLRRLGSRDG